jgi:hypothetical protein
MPGVCDTLQCRRRGGPFYNQHIVKNDNIKDKDDKEEFSVPLRVTIGVTVALCGLFLYIVPIPVCKVWAPELMKAGVALAVEGTINRVEENDKKGNDKK